MHCLKCGQERISTNEHFCRRCGFSFASLERDQEKLKSKPLLRPTRIRRGAALAAFGALLTIVLSIFWNVGAPLELFIRLLSIVSFILVVIGIIQILYAFLFEQNGSFEKQNSASQPDAAQASQLAKGIDNISLPPAQSFPVMNFNSPNRGTAEMVPPPSVTDRTTKLLDVIQNKDESA